MKRAAYIQKNCELQQEFFFAHPRTKLHLNPIYNCHFTGSPIWDLCGTNIEKLEKTWNVSVRQTFGLPRETHKSLIEPVSNSLHLKKLLMMRFISFLNQIESSKKQVPKELLKMIKYDTRSVTGKNVRRITLLAGRELFSEVRKDDIIKVPYFGIEEKEKWRIDIINEIIEIRNNDIEVPGFNTDELSEILNYACTS